MVSKQCVVCGRVLKDNPGAKQPNFYDSRRQICYIHLQEQLNRQYDADGTRDEFPS